MSKTTLGDYSPRWIEHVAVTERKREHVIRRDISRLERLVLPFLGHIDLDDIDKPTIASWLEWLSTLKQKNGKPYSKETKKSAFRLLRTMMRDAQTLVGLEKDPFVGLKATVAGPVEVRTKDTLDVDELLRLLTAADEEAPDIRAMVYVLATTGMRFGEMAALRWEHVDFEKSFFSIEASAVDGNSHPTKTGTKRRTPVRADVAEILREYREWREMRGWPNPHGLVFPSRVGTYRHSTMMRKVFDRCGKRAEIDKRITNQALRRTLQNIVRQTAGEIAARALVGHVTTAMTWHYSDVTDDERQRALTEALGPLT